MGSKKQRNAARRTGKNEEVTVIAVRGRRADWPMVVVALAGMLVTATLSYLAWSMNPLPYCSAGSGCDLVQSSRWSTLLGVPLSVWGFGTYTALWVVALLSARPWRLLTLITSVGLAISLYLLFVSVFSIKATCIYCMASLGLMTVAFVLTWRPVAEVDNTWRLGAGGCAALVVVLLHLHYAGVFNPAAGPEDPRLRDLANYLTASGARFYGASWCPHCREQKTLFAAAAKRLPYVECSPNGPKQPQATDCITANINNYPTWVIGGHRFERILSIEQLSKLSGFAAVSAP